jgi:hypothetical protein
VTILSTSECAGNNPQLLQPAFEFLRSREERRAAWANRRRHKFKCGLHKVTLSLQIGYG